MSNQSPKEDWERFCSQFREFTPEEARDYEEALNRLFIPTGRNIFDQLEGKEGSP